MEITTRSHAKQHGLTIYYTGLICSNGHRAMRRTDSGACVECLKLARQKRARAVNIDAMARSNGARLFSYVLPPKHHAAALAFCQMLDAADGRIPALAPALTAPPAPVWRSREEVLADNAARLNRLQPPAAPPHPFKP